MTPLVVNIKKWRSKCGLSQAQLAEMVGARQATISDFETGKTRRIELDLLEALAKALKCKPADLIEKKAG